MRLSLKLLVNCVSGLQALSDLDDFLSVADLTRRLAGMVIGGKAGLPVTPPRAVLPANELKLGLTSWPMPASLSLNEAGGLVVLRSRSRPLPPDFLVLKDLRSLLSICSIITFSAGHNQHMSSSHHASNKHNPPPPPPPSLPSCLLDAPLDVLRVSLECLLNIPLSHQLKQLHGVLQISDLTCKPFMMLQCFCVFEASLLCMHLLTAAGAVMICKAMHCKCGQKRARKGDGYQSQPGSAMLMASPTSTWHVNKSPTIPHGKVLGMRHPPLALLRQCMCKASQSLRALGAHRYVHVSQARQANSRPSGAEHED